MEPEETLAHLKTIARSMGVVDIGVASADAWNDGRAVEDKRPKEIMTSCRSVVVIGIPLQKTIVDTAPSLYYNHLYKVVNDSLDIAAERIALELNILGHDAIYTPRDGYSGIKGLRMNNDSFFAQKLSAYYAGLGTFGLNGLILTKKHGPRMRFVSVLTSAVLPYDHPLSDELCTECGLCARICPSGAISMDWKIDVDKCLECNEELAKKGISPCGRCVAACPIGSMKSSPPSEKAKASISRYVI